MKTRREVLTARIGAANWSFGYGWQTATSAQSLKTESDAEAALVGADVVALRFDATNPQFAMGYLEPTDRKKGMVAAHAFAAELAKQTVRSAIGLFEIPGGYWLTMIDNDLILVDLGDVVYATVEAAYGEFEVHLRERHWSRIYMPKGLLGESIIRHQASLDGGLEPSPVDRFLAANIKRVSTLPLIEIFRAVSAPRHRQRTIRRNDVYALLTARPAVAAYLVAVAVLTAWLGLLPLYRSLMAPPPAKVAAPPPAPLPALPPAPAEINTPAPSAAYPLTADILSRCFDQFAVFDDQAPAGWEDGSLTCTGGGAVASFHRAGGSLADIEAAFPTAARTYDADYGNVAVAVVLGLPRTARSEVLAGAEPLRRRLYALGWAIDEKISVEAFVPPPGRKAEDKATWRQAGFTVVSAGHPGQWAAVFGDIPGLTVTSVNFDARFMRADPLKVTWEIKGIAYAQ